MILSLGLLRWISSLKGVRALGLLPALICVFAACAGMLNALQTGAKNYRSYRGGSKENEGILSCKQQSNLFVMDRRRFRFVDILRLAPSFWSIVRLQISISDG